MSGFTYEQEKFILINKYTKSFMEQFNDKPCKVKMLIDLCIKSYTEDLEKLRAECR